MRNWKNESSIEPSHEEIRRLIQVDLNRGSDWSSRVLEHLTGCQECRLYADQMASLESHLTHALPLAFPAPQRSGAREETVNQVINRSWRRPMNARLRNALKRAGKALLYSPPSLL